MQIFRRPSIQAIAFSLSWLSAACSATFPANAATHTRQHLTVHQMPAAAMPFGAHYGPDGVLYSAMGSAIPGYVLSQPNKCWVEEGYSQWATCDGD